MSRMCVEVGFIRAVELQMSAERKKFRVWANTDIRDSIFRDSILIGEWDSFEDALGVFSEWCERIEEQEDGE